MLTALAFVLAAPTTPAPAADAAFARMTKLYEDVCLTLFPDDEAVASALAGQHATELKPDETRPYLRGNPGRGWVLNDAVVGKFVVTVKSPPFHACAVRHVFAGAVGDRSAYVEAAARFKSIGPSFRALQPRDSDERGVKSHMDADGRVTNLGAEMLMVVTDTRADGSVEIRFVRQIRK